MNTTTVTFRSQVPVSVERLFQWHQAPDALARLVPPWENAKLIASDGSILPGSRTTLQVKLGPIPLNWIAEHTEYAENQHFQDIQLSGPFSYWKHDHLFEAAGSNESILEDRIEYALPGGFFGGLIAGHSIANKISSMFRYRHDTMIHDLKTYNSNKKTDKMNIAITGATGLVGEALSALLVNDGNQITRMVRSNASDDQVTWNYQDESFDSDKLAGADAVVHLAGDGIANGRWTEAKKKSIYDSRVAATRFLCEKLAAMDNPPKTFICASAIGYYGENGDTLLNEDAAAGESFLSNVCKDWETATQAATDAGIRVVNLRIGVVLSPKGGALTKMLTPFKLCAGGKMGSGQQYWSWIGLDDLISVIHFALTNDSIEGPVNLVSPNAVTNLEFTKTLGKVLGRPTIFPMPGFAARLALGEMADELLLSSIRVNPKKLQDAGFKFRHPDLEDCLRHLLGK